MDKTIDKPKGLLPWLNIKGVSQDAKSSQREYKGSGQEKKKSLPRKEKVSLSLRDDKANKEEPEHSKTGTDKKVKGDELPVGVQAKQIDITI